MTSTDASSGFRVWQLFTVLGFAAATVLVWRETTYTRPEQLIVVSLACLAAALVAVAVHRTLLPLVVPERIVGDSRRGERALVALEREKRLVLRSIKELEFDRAMGKVADADFEEMSARLRDRAMGLMQRIEMAQQGLRARVAADLEALPASEIAGGPRGRRAAMSAKDRAERAPQPQGSAVCSACGTTNDADARFCKQCGDRL